MNEEPFPVCELHGIRLVGAFPQACLLPMDDPLGESVRWKDAAFAALAPESDGGGASLLKRVDTCVDCVWRLSAHPRVRRLRATGLTH
jgi:hypothetical protein